MTAGGMSFSRVTFHTLAGFTDSRSSQIVVAARSILAAAIFEASALQFLDSLVHFRTAGFFAHFLAKLTHYPGDAFRIVFVEAAEGGGVAKCVQSRFLGSRHREARHQARELVASAMLANRVDLFADSHRENTAAPMALATFVFVDGHRYEAPGFVVSLTFNKMRQHLGRKQVERMARLFVRQTAPRKR